MLQQRDLFFSANGIGSCWLGGSKPTKNIEPVAGLEFVVIMAFGKPGDALYRKGTSEIKRKPLSGITDIE